MQPQSLKRFAWLSVFAAIATILLKSLAYYLTGSVGLLSDAIESIVNLAAAILALFMITLSEKPPDKEHAYGHSKAEYFSSIIEGALIFVASISIAITAIERMFNPSPIEHAYVGLAVSALASLLNLFVAVVLLRTGKKRRSITLEADGHHLMTDVWTSAGVIVGVILVTITGIQILDPVIALIVAANIVYTGVHLMKRSAMGLMDTSLPDQDMDTIKAVLDKYCSKGLTYHGLRTRQSAYRRFVSVHILVPGSWTVKKGHDFLEKVEIELCSKLPKTTITTHLEPIEDPKSLNDISLDRKS